MGLIRGGDVMPSDDDVTNEVVLWLQSKGFVKEGFCWGYAWSTRAGIDSTSLLFYPLQRRADDQGWDAIVSHHASGTNPRMVIGRCETLADVQMVCETIRLINGYRRPEDYRHQAVGAVASADGIDTGGPRA